MSEPVNTDRSVFELLARLDERTRFIQNELIGIRSENKERDAKLASMIEEQQGEIKKLKEEIEQDYVRKDTFEPVKRIVYGVVGMILTGVVGSVLSMLIPK